MDTRTLLEELSTKVRTGEIGRPEIERIFSAETKGKHTSWKHLSITQILYVMGAAVVVFGIVAFVAQIWTDIGSIGRILVTLGLGFLIAGSGSVLLTQKEEKKTIGAVFHAVGGVLIPSGAVVTINELFVYPELWFFAAAFFVLALFYVTLLWVHKHPILTFFGIVNGTIFLYAIIATMMDNPAYFYEDVYAHVTMIIGASYLLFGRSFVETFNSRLTAILYFFGSVFFLGAAFTQVFDDPLWQIAYVLFTVGGLFLSAYLSSRSILIVSTIFLIAHTAYITGEYFADSVGWPISLIGLGFLIIGLGYASITINRRYISQKKV